MGRRSGHKPLPGAARHYYQRLERPGDALALQAVVAMLALLQHLHEPLLLEACQMHAGRGRAHFPDDRQLCAGSRVTIEEAVKHPRPCRLANGGRDARRTDLSWRLCNHTWMVDESTVSNNSAPSRCSGEGGGSNCVQSSYAARVR